MHCTTTEMRQHSACLVALKKSTIFKGHRNGQHKSNRWRCTSGHPSQRLPLNYSAPGGTLRSGRGLNTAQTEKSDVKLGILRIVLVSDTTKWMCGTLKYLYDVYIFFGASLLLLLPFGILYNDHLPLDETRFYFHFFALFDPHLICCGCTRSFVELCRTNEQARSFCSIDSISQTYCDPAARRLLILLIQVGRCAKTQHSTFKYITRHFYRSSLTGKLYFGVLSYVIFYNFFPFVQMNFEVHVACMLTSFWGGGYLHHSSP